MTRRADEIGARVKVFRDDWQGSCATSNLVLISKALCVVPYCTKAEFFRKVCLKILTNRISIIFLGHLLLSLMRGFLRSAGGFVGLFFNELNFHLFVWL